MTEQESLLDLALKAVIEALRMNPDRYAIIYDSKYDSDDNASNGSSTITAPILSSSNSTYSTFPKAYQNYYYNKYHEGILEIAKGFVKIMTNQLVDKIMVAAVKEQWSCYIIVSQIAIALTLFPGAIEKIRSS